MSSRRSVTTETGRPPDGTCPLCRTLGRAVRYAVYRREADALGGMVDIVARVGDWTVKVA